MSIIPRTANVAQATEKWVSRHAPHGLSRRQLADLVRHLTRHARADINRRVRAWRENSVVHPEGRPMELLHPGDDRHPTLWLLGWPGGTATPIHDHDDSEVAVSVVYGEIVEDVYPPLTAQGVGQLFSAEPTTRNYYRGTILTMPAPYIHRVRAECPPEEMAVTLHAYFPKLGQMSFFDPEGVVLVKSGEWKS